MFNFFKNNKPRIELYNLEISANSSRISIKDLLLLKFFLNFSPSKKNLSCSIRTFSDNAFANIYCETPSNEWRHLNDEMVEITRLLEVHSYPEDALNLLDIPEEDYPDSLDEKIIISKAIDLINDHRKEFQTKCTIEDKIYFDNDCSVNYFKIIWGTSNYMNFISVDWG